MDFSDIKIDKIFSTVALQRTRGEVIETTNRRHCGIVVIKSGKLSFFQNDNEFVQTPDVAVILPKGIDYSLHCHDDASCYLINFEEETGFLTDKIHTVNLTQKNNVIDKVDKMCRTWSMRSNSYNLILMSLMYSIFADFNIALSMDKQQRKYYEIIKPSIEYMEEHYCDSDIKNDDLAKISSISTVYFRKIFTKLYGLAPIHYLEIRKIEKAKELLEYDDLSITEIAIASGFKDIYHFCRAFKKITGFSPNKYRKEFLP